MRHCGLILLAALMVATPSCNSRRKSDTSQYKSYWPASPNLNYGPYQVYIHRTWSYPETTCILTAVRAHYDVWYTFRGANQFGAPKHGKIFIHGKDIRFVGDGITRSDTIYFASSNTDGGEIHIVVRPNRYGNMLDVPGLTICIDQHQDPFLEGFDPWYADKRRWAAVGLVEVAAEQNVYYNFSFTSNCR